MVIVAKKTQPLSAETKNKARWSFIFESHGVSIASRSRRCCLYANDDANDFSHSFHGGESK